MTKFSRVIRVITLFVVLFATQVFASDWQVEIEESDMTISTRSLADSDYLQVKAVVNIQAPVDKVLQQFQATGQCWPWQLRCDKIELLSTHNEKQNTVYVIIDTPWPIADRDFVLNYQVTKYPELNKVILTMSPSDVEKTSDYVRAKSNVTYTLEGTDKTKLTVLMHTEFGGSTPASLVNGMLHEELQADLEKLIELVEK